MHKNMHYMHYMHNIKNAKCAKCNSNAQGNSMSDINLGNIKAQGLETP